MKISKVSEECGISPDTLRYYERIGLLPPVHRSESGIRDDAVLKKENEIRQLEI